MKISKRSNGSYALRVNQVEATISGSQSIKDVYELYEKLIRLVGDGKELKKVEIQDVLKTKDDLTKQEPHESRPEKILNCLKKHGPLPAGLICEKTNLETTQFYGAIHSMIKYKRVKRKKSPDGYIYSVGKESSDHA